MLSLLAGALAATSFLPAAAAIPYSEYILAPSQRVLTPVSVHRANGSVTNPSGLTIHGSGHTVLNSVSAITYDYGVNIGGLVSFTVGGVNGSNNFIGIGFSESSFWIAPDGSDATQNVGLDEILWYPVNKPGNYSVDNAHQRGGFRYLSLHHNSSGSVALSSVTTNFTAMPHYADDAMRDYTGYFHCNNEQLNRVWYAAAYTDQLCTIPSTSGNSLVDLLANDSSIPTFWYSNSTLTNGTSALVDGAKRDKLIWPGDFSISLPGVFLSTNDQYTLKLSVAQLFAEQNASTGQLRYAADTLHPGQPAGQFFTGLNQVYSYTYHMYNLLALNNYYIYSGDIDFLRQNWYRFNFGLNYSLTSVDSTGLAYVATNATADWLRVGMGAHNIEANSILAYTLTRAMTLAHAVGDTSQNARWQSYYDNIVSAANELLWDESAGLFTDNQTTTLHPQDGNSWAVISGVANSTRAATISSALHARWGPYGAPAPEAGTTISPFISGFELQAHYIAGQPQYANALMEYMWGDFMLDDPRMTNSTFNEGYDVSGALHYPAYADDARISHAHGWSTGPLLALTNYAAGLHVINSSTWLVQPQPGNLTNVEAGFTTAIGTFGATYSSGNGSTAYSFQAPPGTTGTVILSGISGSLRSSNGTMVPLVSGVAEHVAGGNWTLVASSGSTLGGNGGANGSYAGGSGSSPKPVPYTGGTAKKSASILALIAVACVLVL
ncbi:hypothetical protein LTR91_016267 [Friedmanniomyces endolithicus]|uniref:Alpha-L-rhamnosidase six-hairpin glycosidase domain-containing protein n=1 Tax=Friedmanniomyces endolithicus TaxID=329885 RepID=A0AAN6FUJ2_9PEZI|nr:hypothetical protein LTS09_013386 [Friedmanniomyces endolithicus]KAK0291683.1 hypothetical protein LTR35_001111 [Friedmanniomyces endolithicus]KAK0296644.1 hypothetical protein LTS00_004969 [Friedmanniomyces endolithicus]KAK0304057.1 hypothetical protein LTR01_007674 [Friedmanniomyces endolithicus]KAK0324792.1 hypothetical protein LTR82_004497 [Friedmanniomyces endolithicus]